jgi:hypothetical protein
MDNQTPRQPPRRVERIMSIPLLTFFTPSSPTWFFALSPRVAALSPEPIARILSPFPLPCRRLDTCLLIGLLERFCDLSLPLLLWCLPD